MELQLSVEKLEAVYSVLGYDETGTRDSSKAAVLPLVQPEGHQGQEAVKADDDFNLVNPRTGEVQDTVKAKELFDQIVDMAWRTGDPGIVFIDRINESNPTPHLGKIESTNPCGEQPLLPYESCNLGSINLSRMLKITGDTAEIDYEKLSISAVSPVIFSIRLR